MQQLTGLDNDFLVMEAGGQLGHVGSLCLYDPKGLRGRSFRRRSPRRSRRGCTCSALPAPPRRGAARPRPPVLDRGPGLRPRLPPPAHRGAAARRRAAARQLVARIHGRALDRARPLWEAYVIEGCANGRVALYTKIHHCTIDGVSGAEMMRCCSTASPRATRCRTAQSREARGRAGLARDVRARSARPRAPARPHRAHRVPHRARPRPAGGRARRRRAQPRPRPPAARGRLPAPARAAARRGADPADARAAHAVEPLDHAAPPLRLLLAAARAREAGEDRVRHHAQRRGDGALGIRAAPLPLDKDALPDTPLIAMVPVSVRSESRSASSRTA